MSGAFNRIPKVDLMADFSNLLAEVGYNEIVTEKVNFDIFYKSIIGILKDIKNMGEKIPIIEKKENDRKPIKNDIRTPRESCKNRHPRKGMVSYGSST